MWYSISGRSCCPCFSCMKGTLAASASALESFPQPGPLTSLASSLPRAGCWDTGAPPDLGCFFTELAAHRDLVQGAVWSRDGALVGTTCKVSRRAPVGGPRRALFCGGHGVQSTHSGLTCQAGWYLGGRRTLRSGWAFARSSPTSAALASSGSQLHLRAPTPPWYQGQRSLLDEDSGKAPAGPAGPWTVPSGSCHYL